MRERKKRGRVKRSIRDRKERSVAIFSPTAPQPSSSSKQEGTTGTHIMRPTTRNLNIIRVFLNDGMLDNDNLRLGKRSDLNHELHTYVSRSPSSDEGHSPSISPMLLSLLLPMIMQSSSTSPKHQSNYSPSPPTPRSHHQSPRSPTPSSV